MLAFVQVAATLPSVDDIPDRTVLDYISQASQHFSTVLEIVKPFGDVSSRLLCLQKSSTHV
jgi:hypothetical protein